MRRAECGGAALILKIGNEFAPVAVSLAASDITPWIHNDSARFDVSPCNCCQITTRAFSALQAGEDLVEVIAGSRAMVVRLRTSEFDAGDLLPMKLGAAGHVLSRAANAIPKHPPSRRLFSTTPD
jgi:hypothetical protein